jgi:hypothetical protein
LSTELWIRHCYCIDSKDKEGPRQGGMAARRCRDVVVLRPGDVGDVVWRAA